MSATPTHTRANIIPCLRYRDAPAAIDWLCDTFGFEKQLIVPGDQGAILHAQLSFGNGMIMLGSIHASSAGYGELLKQPDEIGGAATQTIHVVVQDADVVHDKAKDAGADIIRAIQDEDFGGRSFMCRDREGHIWSFGTYDPCA